MIITNYIKSKKIFILLIILSNQIHALNEKDMGAMKLKDILAFDVKNVPSGSVKLIIENGLKLDAWRWSVFYDDLMVYAQAGIHLPPLRDFTHDMQITIKNNWLKAQKLGAHQIDCQGILYLVKPEKLLVAAEQWPISEYDFLYFFENDIELPPLEEFTYERQNKIKELLKKLGLKAPKIAKPKPLILLAAPVSKPPAPMAVVIPTTHPPSQKPTANVLPLAKALVYQAPSTLSSQKPLSSLSRQQQEQFEILPELLDITWNPSPVNYGFTENPAFGQAYLNTNLYHQVQPLPHSTAASYMTHSSASNSSESSKTPSSASTWNIWGCTPAQEYTHADLLLVDTNNTDLLIPEHIKTPQPPVQQSSSLRFDIWNCSSLSTNAQQELILPAPRSGAIVNEPIDFVDLTLLMASQKDNSHSSYPSSASSNAAMLQPQPATTNNLPSESPEQSVDADLMAQFLRLGAQSTTLAVTTHQKPLSAQQQVSSDKELEERLNSLYIDDMEKRLRALRDERVVHEVPEKKKKALMIHNFDQL